MSVVRDRARMPRRAKPGATTSAVVPGRGLAPGGLRARAAIPLASADARAARSRDRPPHARAPRAGPRHPRASRLSGQRSAAPSARRSPARACAAGTIEPSAVTASTCSSTSIGRRDAPLPSRHERALAVLPRAARATRSPTSTCEIAFEDGAELWFQDPRRFGMLRVVATDRAYEDPRSRVLGPGPDRRAPPTGRSLARSAPARSVAMKNFLLDQRRIAGIGNIYASEILHRARVDPGGAAGRLDAGGVGARRRGRPARARRGDRAAWGPPSARYRTLWNEPGAYGERLLVYDRAGEPCRRCGAPIRRIVQGQRSTFYCPSCQTRAKVGRGDLPKSRRWRPRTRPVDSHC